MLKILLFFDKGNCMKKFVFVLMLVLGFFGTNANANTNEMSLAEKSCAFLDIILPTLLEAQQKGATLEKLDGLLDQEAKDSFEIAKQESPDDPTIMLFMLGSFKYANDILDEISKQPKQKGKIKLEKHIEQFTKKHKTLCVARIEENMKSGE